MDPGNQRSHQNGNAMELAPQITLNTQQQLALSNVTQGHNTFITGPAGVGKSILISQIRAWASVHGKKVVVSAMTGVAASNVNGATLHSWTSMGLGKGEPKKMAFYIKRREASLERYMDVDILIIDEISMADFEYFKKFDEVAQIVRNKKGVPFGGIQVVLCGDFFQLGPIQRDRKKPKYLFEDAIWGRLVEKSVHLKEVYRQKNNTFVEILHKIRVGDVTDDIVTALQAAKDRDLTNELGVTPTKLFCKNVDVDVVNKVGLQQLAGKEHKYDSITYFENEDYRRLYEKSFTLPERVTLKVGAQVMLIINLDVENGFVNGSRGVVVDIYEPGHELYTQGAVVVQFANGSLKVIKHHKQSFKDDNSSTDSPDRASRIQYPLKLAYALTVHKSQGLSIDYLEVDLKGCFTAGQAYVALSRATSFDKLRVINFCKRIVIASSAVKGFYASLDNSSKRPREGTLDDVVKRAKIKVGEEE